MRIKKSLTAIVAAIVVLVGVVVAVPSAGARVQSGCGLVKQDYAGSTYVGMSLRSTGAAPLTFTFATDGRFTLRSTEGWSDWPWFITDRGITVNTLSGPYFATTRVCDGFGAVTPSMIGGVMRWEGLETHPFTLYRQP
jgi:hypothetical protein